MKKFVPRLIAFGVIFLVAVLGVLLKGFSSAEPAIFATICLGILAARVFVRKDLPIMEDLPFFALAWVLFTFMFPSSGFRVQKLTDGIVDFAYILEEAFSNPLFWGGVIIFVILQLFIRKYPNPICISLRYLALLALMLGACQGEYETFYECNISWVPAIVITLWAILYELKSHDAGENDRKAFCSLFVFTLYVFFVCCFRDPYESGYYFAGMQGLMNIPVWLWNAFGAAILGGVMLLESHNLTKNLKQKKPAFHDFGGFLVFWAVLSLIMHVWHTCYTWLGLVILPMALYYGYGFFARRQKQVYSTGETKIFLLSWSIASVGILIFSKFFFYSNFYLCIAMLLLLIAGGVCWSISVNKNSSATVMNCFYGVAVITLIAAVKLNLAEDYVAMALQLLSMAFLSVLWCALCISTGNLHRGASVIHASEYKLPVKVEKWISLSLLGVIGLTYLFV